MSQIETLPPHLSDDIICYCFCHWYQETYNKPFSICEDCAPSKVIRTKYPPETVKAITSARKKKHLRD